MKHNYELRIRFGQNESFRDASRNTWRWAWSTLNPPINYLDVIAMRTVLTDQLSSQVLAINGDTAAPVVMSTMNDIKNWNWRMVAMGFVGKDLECADMLLREAERDKTARGKKMRQAGSGHDLNSNPSSADGAVGWHGILQRANRGITSGCRRGCGMQLRICA